MLRFLSTLRTGLLAGVRWVLQALRTVPALWGRLQPRSWRTWLLLVLALPALLAVYTLLLIPFVAFLLADHYLAEPSLKAFAR